MLKMEYETDLRNIVPTFSNQKQYLCEILDETDFSKLVSLKEELKDTWTKKQIFRTETEMRVSVLNDAKHPTKASKYWQCIREQNAFFETTMQLSFEYRKNEVEIKKIQRKIDNETDDLERELLQIDLEERLYAKSNMQLVAKDRIRELDLWSKLKAELDDGSFDTENVNTHQMESIQLTLQNRAKALSPGTSPAEVMNVMGPLQTAARLNNENKLAPSKQEKLPLGFKQDSFKQSVTIKK
jgi:hypothetical protein